MILIVSSLQRFFKNDPGICNHNSPSLCPDKQRIHVQFGYLRPLPGQLADPLDAGQQTFHIPRFPAAGAGEQGKELERPYHGPGLFSAERDYPNDKIPQDLHINAADPHQDNGTERRILFDTDDHFLPIPGHLLDQHRLNPGAGDG
jgi:hypothetical protein